MSDPKAPPEPQTPQPSWELRARAAEKELLRLQADPQTPVQPAEEWSPDDDLTGRVKRWFDGDPEQQTSGLIQDLEYSRDAYESRLATLEADLQRLSSEHEELKAERDEQKLHIDTLNTWIAAAVEAASPFQNGGPLADKLMWGASTVVDGMRWLLAEHERLKAELAEEECAHARTIDERDAFHDAADKLAYAIAPENVIGEHSSMNDPWENAVEQLDVQRQQLDTEKREAVEFGWHAGVEWREWDLRGGMYPGGPEPPTNPSEAFAAYQQRQPQEEGQS